LTVPTRTEPATAPTRERLLAAARALVEERGYAGASVLAVADRAGVAAGTLYRHFRSKDELFVELFRAVCDRELEAMRAGAAAEDLSHAERIAGILETFSERALRRPRLAWALLAEPVAPALDAERLAYRARYRAVLAATLNDGIVAGELPEQDAELIAAALVGGCGEALVGPLVGPRVPPLVGPLDDTRPPPSRDEATIAALRTFVLRAIGATS
jgi:AcrR family transcriptional regulator